MSDASPFDPAACSRHVDTLLAAIPDRAQRCCVVYYRTDGTVTLAHIERLGPHWTAGVILGHAPRDGWTGQVALKGVW